MRALGLIPAAACLAVAVSLTAQEGHPLTGTWSGEHTLSSGERARVVLVMTWDGKAVAGTINPGPGAIPFGRVTIDYDTWTVRIEAKAPKPPAEILIEGQLAELGSWHRTFSGRWVQGSTEGTFRLRRD